MWHCGRKHPEQKLLVTPFSSLQNPVPDRCKATLLDNPISLSFTSTTPGEVTRLSVQTSLSRCSYSLIYGDNWNHDTHVLPLPHLDSQLLGWYPMILNQNHPAHLSTPLICRNVYHFFFKGHTLGWCVLQQ